MFDLSIESPFNWVGTKHMKWLVLLFSLCCHREYLLSILLSWRKCYVQEIWLYTKHYLAEEQTSRSCFDKTLYRILQVQVQFQVQDSYPLLLYIPAP